MSPRDASASNGSAVGVGDRRPAECDRDAGHRLVTREEREHRPKLGAALGARERQADGLEVPADRLHLADELARAGLVELLDTRRAQLGQPLERRPRVVSERAEHG